MTDKERDGKKNINTIKLLLGFGQLYLWLLLDLLPQEINRIGI